MNQKGYSVLRALLSKFAPTTIDKVVTAKDPNVKKDYFPEITNLCIENNIPYYDRVSDYKLKTQYSFAIGWRWLIKTNKSTRLITLHDSLLPKYRGFNPLVTALICQDSHIGVTALFSTEQYDRGEIICQMETKINHPIRISDAIDKISPLYDSIVLEITETIFSNKPIKSYKQDEDLATYSLWRTEEDYHIDWTKSSKDILTLIYSIGHPYKGAYSTVDQQKIRIFDADIVPDVTVANRSPGKVIFLDQQLPVVVCGQGLLKITEAVDDSSGETILPLKKFRSKFT